MANHNNGDDNYMAYHKIDGISESEQMYLITATRLEEEGASSPFPLSTLANELGVQPVSVHQMARKLEENGLAKYIPYKGLELTSQGRTIAVRILRNRRLWEVFLVEHLKLPFDESHAFSCLVEHITTPEIAERLSRLLGDPLVNPQGKLIPSTKDTENSQTCIPLSQLSALQKFQIIRIEAGDTERLFLRDEGLYPGTVACIHSIGGRGAILLEGKTGGIYIAPELAQKIYVQLLDTDTSSEK
jgi:DtxR family transcriptional regulator, Mn-dependent transcriptional regulator